MNDNIHALPNGDFWVDRRIQKRRDAENALKILDRTFPQLADAAVTELLPLGVKVERRVNPTRRFKQVNR